MSQSQLPRGFEDLEPFVEWSLATELERSARRQASSMADIQRFYDAMLPRMEEILQFLQRCPPDDNPADVQTLFQMTLSLAEIAPAVENFHQPSVVDGYDVKRFIPVELYPRAAGGAGNVR